MTNITNVLLTNVLLLDSTLYKQCNNYDEKFYQLTNTLLNKTLLVINNKEYRLREIELYLFTDDHPDTYTHKDIDQNIPCRWYFHKKGNTYKGGTYKGLDITFGFQDPNKCKITYAGILIRGISNNNNLVTGPSKVVDHILRETKFEKITDLVKNLESLYDVSKKSLLYLRYNDMLEQLVIYSGPRVGLSFKYPVYAVKNYRYLTYRIKEIEKYKPSIIFNLANSGKMIEEVARESESKVHQIKKYMDFYQLGKKLNDIKDLKPSATNIIILCGFMNKNN